MGGHDDLDLYGRGARPDRASAGLWLVRILGVLAGAAASFYGVATILLRCFDTCPTDPSLDKAIQLIAASAVLFGLAVAIAAASAGTRWAPGAAVLVAVLGAVVAVAGAATLALVPSIDDPGGDGGTGLAGALALVAGSAVAAAGAFARRRFARPRD